MSHTSSTPSSWPRIASARDLAKLDLLPNQNVSRETWERLETYVALLHQWQKAVNLVSPTTLPHVWHRHVADSAQLLTCLPKPANQLSGIWLDLGSGAGFPGLVIAILLRDISPIHVHLVEAQARKAAFLQEVVRKTGVHVEIHATRIETLRKMPRLTNVSIVSARALAPLPKLLDLAAPFFQSESVGLFLKGKAVAEEIAAAKRAWMFHVKQFPARTGEGTVLEIRDPKPIDKRAKR